MILLRSILYYLQLPAFFLSLPLFFSYSRLFQSLLCAYYVGYCYKLVDLIRDSLELQNALLCSLKLSNKRSWLGLELLILAQNVCHFLLALYDELCEMFFVAFFLPFRIGWVFRIIRIFYLEVVDPSFNLPSLSYSRKASFSSSCMAATSSTSSSTKKPAARVTNSSNSNWPDPAN